MFYYHYFLIYIIYNIYFLNILKNKIFSYIIYTMTFRKLINTIKNNKQTLLDFVGYDTITELKNDGGFRNNTEAFNYAKQEYNKEVRAFNYAERNSTIINPLTNRKIKKYTIFDLDGKIRSKYVGKLSIENGVLVKNKIIIGIDIYSKEIAKFNIDNVGAPFLQQTFGFNIPKNQIVDNNQVNNIIFKHELEPDEQVVLTLRVKFRIWFSKEWEEKMVVVTRLVSGRQLSQPDYALNLVQEDAVWASLTPITQLIIVSLDILTTKNNAKMKLEDMILREAEPLNISSLYNEIIHEKRIENCIHDYMFKIYPKHSKSEKQKNKIRELNTTNDIYEWCKLYGIKMIAYDINGNVIKAFYPEKNKKLKNMIYIAFNNHLYPLKNNYLNKNKIKKYRVKICENAKEELIKTLNIGIFPKDIKIDREGQICSFLYNNEDDKLLPVYFTQNNEYYKCLEILEKFGLKDKMSVDTKINHLGSIIETLYRQDKNANSFFPFGANFNKGGYNYNNEDIELEENEIFQTIDKNKSYSYELSQLPYLINCDVKYHKHKKINEIIKNHKIIPHYLYIIDIDTPSLILPNNDYFEGQTLIDARENGLNFRIIEEQETEKTENYFKDMINDLYEKIDNDTFKQIVNIHIGKFEMSSMKYDYLNFDKLLCGDELDTFDGHVFPLDESYNVGCKTKSSINIFNKKPISVQIKDRSRLRLFNMMKTLKLKNSDIKQVKTDSITFKKTNDNYLEYIHDNLSGWKTEDFTAIQKPNIMKRMPITFEYKNFSGGEYDSITESGTIGLGNAGCGKTYKIINEIIPKLDNDYIVLSPSYATITDYKKLDLNCHVIQTYTFSSEIPEAHNIIVDEIGMVGVSAWNMLIRCKIAGKNVMVFGDNTQHEPVNSRLCDNPNFYNLMFDTHLPYNTNNYRNNFSVKYYDELRQTNKNGKKRLNEVLKYNTEWDKAEVILAYTRDTRDKYNKLMCEKLGIKSLGDNGAKIICKSNDLRELNIYNNFCYEVINNGKTIILNNGVDKIELEPKFLKYFDYSYARTTHSVQGQTLKSFHYCIEDIKFLGGRGLYTLISRLKHEKPVIKKVEIKKKIIKKTTTKHSLFNAWLDKKNGL